MQHRPTFLETFFLAGGTAILVHQLVIEKNDLSMGVLAIVLFAYGYTISSVADRHGDKGPLQFLVTITDLIRAIRGQEKGPPQ